MSSPAYAVVVNRSARKEIRSLDAAMRLRVIRELRALSTNPRPPGCRKLSGARDRWRVRVGDYRIIYTIDDAGRLVEIAAVSHRSKAYE
jgi:mRNA interferase RelE/StbE